MVFKSMRYSPARQRCHLAFRGRAYHVTQNHPVYIPRDLSSSAPLVLVTTVGSSPWRRGRALSCSDPSPEPDCCRTW